MIEKFSHFIVKRRWWVVATWVLAAIALSAFAPQITSIESNDQSSFLPSHYESIKASTIASEITKKSDSPTDMAIVTRKDGDKLTEADKTAIEHAVSAANAKRLPRVNSITTDSNQVSPNGTAQLVSITYAGTADDADTINAVPKVRTALTNVFAGTGLKTGVTGENAIGYDTQDSAANAEAIVGIVTILLVVLLPIIIFRSPLSGLLPLLAVGVVFSLSQRLIALAGTIFNFNVSQQLSILFTVVLFGIGTDYILFLLFRYRERLRGGHDVREAVAYALSRAGEAIFSAALVVVCSFAALFFADFGIFSSMAPSLVICVATMMVAALTLVPALLAIMTDKIFWPSKKWALRASKPTLSKHIGGFVARRPASVVVSIVVILGIMATGALKYQGDFSSFSQPPAGTQSAEAYTTLTKAFPAGVLAPTPIYIKSDQNLVAADLKPLENRLKATTGVSSVTPAMIVPSHPHIAIISIVLTDDPYSTAAINNMAGIRASAHSINGKGITAYVGGATSAIADVQAVTNRDLAVIFPIAALFIFVILAVLLRSLVAPIILLLSVGLGFVATLGATTWIYQGIGNAAGLISFIPLFMYIFVVAIGTDYNILTITRLREEVREGNDPRTAADLTIEHSSATVTSAGFILAATFASLLLGGISFLLQMGTSIALGVALAAFVIAPFLIPATSALMGYSIWWPNHKPTKKNTK